MAVNKELRSLLYFIVAVCIFVAIKIINKVFRGDHRTANTRVDLMVVIHRHYNVIDSGLFS